MAERFERQMVGFHVPSLIEQADLEDPIMTGTMRGIAHGKVKDTDGYPLGHPSAVYLDDGEIKANLRRIARLYGVMQAAFQAEWDAELKRAVSVTKAIERGIVR